MTSLTKNPHPPGKKFFSNAIYLTGRSFWAVEQLSSAIGGGARALVRQLKTAVFFYENHQNYPDAKVLSNYSQNFINFDHNFWTRNPSRSSKLSKDSNCSLVSNKNFSEILPSNGWRPRPGEVGQKVFHLWCHSQKNPDPQPKNIFQVQTTRLAESFDTSTRSVTLTGAEIFPRKATHDPAVFLGTAWINPDIKVLSSFGWHM